MLDLCGYDDGTIFTDLSSKDLENLVELRRYVMPLTVQDKVYQSCYMNFLMFAWDTLHDSLQKGVWSSCSPSVLSSNETTTQSAISCVFLY